MQGWFFNGGDVLMRTLLIGLSAYAGLVLLLRVSGKRTLSKMNAFDLVVTVALGSTLSSILISKEVALSQGLLALALLIGMQFAVTWTSVRVRWVRKATKSEPHLLYHHGCILQKAMKDHRVTEDELLAAVRGAGYASLGQVQAVVLETDGSFSVLRPTAGGGNSALAPLQQ